MVLQWGFFFHSLTQFILTQSHVCHPVAAKKKNSLVCINKPLKLFHRNVLFSPV